MNFPVHPQPYFYSNNLFPKAQNRCSFPFSATVILVSNWILDLIDRLRQKYFPNEVTKRGNELRVSSYSVNNQINMNITTSEGVKLDSRETVRRFFKGVDLKGKLNVLFSEATNPENPKDQIPVLDPFYQDMNRINAITVNGKVILDMGKEHVDVAKIKYETSKKLSLLSLNPHVYFNLTALMHQGMTPDSWGYLMEEFNKGRKTNHVAFSSILGEGLAFDVEEKERQICIKVKFPLQIKKMGVQDCCGYIAVERQITLSRTDLARDWSGIPLDNITPSLEIKDYYSRYADSITAAQRNINLLIFE